MRNVTAREYLSEITPTLAGDLPELDAQVILSHVMDCQRTWLLAHLDALLTPPQLASAEEAFARLRAGTPLPYIIGHWEFFGLDFDITEDVLIPRPETELLVEKAISLIKASPERRTIADIGTGSGAIAVTIAMHIPDARILATDISPAALQIARHNAKKFHVQDQIEFMECDLLPNPNVRSNALRLSKAQNSSFILSLSSFDLICSNPPYIPTNKLHRLTVFGREPTLALDGGADGLEIYRRLFELAPDWLAPHGIMLLETEASVGVRVLGLACDSFSEAAIHLHQDLTGRDRLLEIMFI